MPMISAMNIHITPMTNNAVIGGDLQRKTKTQKVCTAIAFECAMRVIDCSVLETTHKRPVNCIRDLKKVILTYTHVRATPTSPICFKAPGKRRNVSNVDT
jgi:hypothetical protein